MFRFDVEQKFVQRINFNLMITCKYTPWVIKLSRTVEVQYQTIKISIVGGKYINRRSALVKIEGYRDTQF